MRLIVNGDPIDMDERSTVAHLVMRVAEVPQGKGTAVAVNGEVVPRARWSSVSLTEGDKVEVLKAVGGG